MYIDATVREKEVQGLEAPPTTVIVLVTIFYLCTTDGMCLCIFIIFIFIFIIQRHAILHIVNAVYITFTSDLFILIGKSHVWIWFQN